MIEKIFVTQHFFMPKNRILGQTRYFSYFKIILKSGLRSTHGWVNRFKHSASKYFSNSHHNVFGKQR